MKFQLPNGCYYGKFTINPKNWLLKGAKTTENWFISYRFYDPRFIKPKQVMIASMNSCKLLADRKAKTEELISKELEPLNKGYNPFNTKDTSIINDAEITGDITFKKALDFAKSKAAVGERTLKDLHYVIEGVDKVLKELGWEHIQLSKVDRKTIRIIFDRASNSAYGFNKNSSYFMILFSIVYELEFVPFLREIYF